MGNWTFLANCAGTALCAVTLNSVHPSENSVQQCYYLNCEVILTTGAFSNRANKLSKDAALLLIHCHQFSASSITATQHKDFQWRRDLRKERGWRGRGRGICIRMSLVAGVHVGFVSNNHNFFIFTDINWLSSLNSITCTFQGRYRRFVETYSFLLQGRNTTHTFCHSNLSSVTVGHNNSVLKMKAVVPSETSASVSKTTLCQNPEHTVWIIRAAKNWNLVYHIYWNAVPKSYVCEFVR